jgi:branched-chain amino acid transport system permease protein
MIGGVVLGIAQQLTATYLGSELQTPLSLALLLVILIARPSGVLGRRMRAL